MNRRKPAEASHAQGVAQPAGRPGGTRTEPDPEEDLRVANEALVELTARYRALFETNPHPILVWDIETLRILDVNEASIRRYGWSLEEFRRLTLKDLWPPETVPKLMRWLASNHDEATRSGVFRHR